MKDVKGEQLVFVPGEVIFEEGDESNSLMFIQEGKVEVFRIREGLSIVLGTMGAGEFLGTVTLFSKEPRTAGARALTQTKVLVMKAAQLEQGLKSVPSWISSVVKDTVARLKFVDERFVESKLKERQLLNKVGTSLHVAAQLARFIAAQGKLVTVEVDGNEVFPTSGLVPTASGVLMRQLEQVASIYNAFAKSGVIKEVPAGKAGQGILKKRLPLLEEFATFAINASKNNLEGFAPQKLYTYMSALVKVRKKLADADSWPRLEVISILGKELGRDVPEDTLHDLIEWEVCKSQPQDAVSFQHKMIEKRVMFETACRIIHEADEEDQ